MFACGIVGDGNYDVSEILAVWRKNSRQLQVAV